MVDSQYFFFENEHASHLKKYMQKERKKNGLTKRKRPKWPFDEFVEFLLLLFQYGEGIVPHFDTVF